MLEIISTNETERLKLKLERIRARNVALDSELLARVAVITEDVRRSGDQALVKYAACFDGLELDPADLRISKEQLEESASQADQVFIAALREAIKRVRIFHECERQHSWEFETENGSRLGQRITALESAGVYVPGGTASYPSSVVMNVVPAQVAGVDRIVVASPPRSIRENPAIAAALIE
ncbi:MAG TPA: histidinol dehydrogenase, partial [Pyrinomonadaceae bacterium]|nr:histidinol dehydrogenase [Pyrinomonadaceae bacterium]